MLPSLGHAARHRRSGPVLYYPPWTGEPRLIRRRLQEIWPDMKGQRLLGVGYATPYLRVFRDKAERVLAAMHASQGVIHWPKGEPGLVTLTEEVELPFPDSSIDRVLLIHALENAEQVRPMLREVWRVMTSSGRLLVVVPNRRGVWARIERTPFGYGQPFSPPQLTRLLRETMFSPTTTSAAVSIPPVTWPPLLKNGARDRARGTAVGPSLRRRFDRRGRQTNLRRERRSWSPPTAPTDCSAGG